MIDIREFRHYTHCRYGNGPDKTSRKLKELIKKIIFPGKKNTFAFKELTLYPAEIHLIPVMDETPANAVQMARMRF